MKCQSFALFVFICILSSCLPVTADEFALIPRTGSKPKEHTEYEVLGVGTAITDLIITVSDEFLEKHAGQKGGSQVVPIQKIDEIIKHSHLAPVEKPGGSCANTIKGLARLGIKAAYHLRDGIDEYGIRYEQSLLDNNVAVLKVNDDLLPSGRLACLVTPDKNRTFLAAPSAGAAFCPADLQATCFKKAKLVHLDGYSLRNESLVEESMKLAKEHGALISFDPGCFQLVREHKKLLLRLMKDYIDVLFVNEDEIKELFALPVVEGAKAIGQLVRVAVVLRGNKGCLVSTKEKLLTVPVRNVSVVDTTGAGDLFASGFLYGILKGYDLERCAYTGNYLGSSVIQHVGAEIPEERWSEILSHVTKESSKSLCFAVDR